MNVAQLTQAIKVSGRIPNEDADMHANAIFAGEYLLSDLFANASAFYSYDGYAHETALVDTM